MRGESSDWLSYLVNLHRVTSPVVELGTLSGPVLPVTGNLVAAGDVGIYHFNVGSPRSVVLDSLTWDDSMRLSLTGPTGQVSDRLGNVLIDRPLGHFTDYSYWSGGQVDLVAGDYTLVIRNSGNGTGGYGLRVLDIAAATVISPGTVVSGQLSPGNTEQIYAFNALAGDNIDLTPLSADAGTNPNFVLLDPYGRRVTYTGYFQAANNLTLSTTGRYTLQVQGENFRTEADSYSFQITPHGNTPPPPLASGAALSLGSTTTFSLPSGGGSTVFNFSLTQDTTVYFDPQSITPNSDSYWNLAGPRGTEVGDSYLGWYYGFEGARVIRLVAGDYAMSFRSSQQVDSFAFRLLDLGQAAAPLTVNADTIGTLNPGSGAAAYTFDGTAGQRLFFQATFTTNGNLRWHLYDPYNRDLTNNAGWNDWESTLGSSGKYTLGATPVDYSFKLQKPVDTITTYDPAVVNTASPQWTGDSGSAAVLLDGNHDIKVDANPALNLRDDVSFQVRVRVDNFDQTWQSIVYKGPNSTDYNSRSYTLWANAAGRLYLTTSDNYGEMALYAPVGTLNARQWYDVSCVIDRSNGLMKIYMDGAEVASTTIRTYAGNSRIQDTPLYLGNAHEGAGYSDSQLQGAISEFRLFDRALSAADITAYLSAPPTANDAHLKAWLKMDESSGVTLADASASHLSATIHSRFEGLTGVLTGRIDQPGQQAVIHLNLPQGGNFYLDSLTQILSNQGSYPLNLRIDGPRIAFNENLTYFYNRVINLPAGDYTFTVDGSGRNTGSFAFRVIGLDTAQAVQYGDAVSGDLNPGDTAKLFKFTATAGDPMYFQSLGATGQFNPAWRLVDPFGREVFGRTGLTDRDVTTLAYSGTYTVIVDGDYGNHDQFTHFGFRLINVAPTTVQTFDPACGLDAGVQRTAGTGTGGAVQVSDAQFLEFANTPATGQTGSYTLQTSFRIDRASSNSWIPLVLKSNPDTAAQIGIYLNNDGRIQVGAQPGSAGYGYSYVESPSGTVTADVWHKLTAVYDRANSQIRVMLDGVQVASGYLAPVAGVDLADALRIGYNNDGNNYSGGQVSVDQLAIWNRALTTPELAVLDAGTLAGNEANLVALYRMDEATGATLTDALGGAAGSIVRKASLTHGLVTGRITQLGQTQHYRFTLAQARTLYFDSFTHRYDLRWSLNGPTVAQGDTFYNGDSNNGRNLLTLAAGTYDITVDGDGAATGDYMFRFVDAAQAQTFALDQVVTGQIDPGLDSRLFHFDASAGQQIYFDVLSATRQAPAWRLLDPSGAQVFGVSGFSDRDTLTLARTGTYTLIVEDYTSSGQRSVARDFSFILRTVADVSKTITLGSNTVRDPQWTAGPVAGETAVKFDGTNQIVTDPSATLDLTGDLTMELMVKVDGYANTWTPLFSRGSGLYHQSLGLWLGSSGQVNVDSNWQGNFWNFGSAAGVVQLGQWNRISATIDRTHGVARIYVNGAEVATSGIDGRSAASQPDARLHIGSTDITNGDRGELYGAVSDVRLWNTVRSAAEIGAAQGLTLPGNEAGLVLNLALNEGAGRTLTDSSASHLGVRNADLYEGLSPTLVEGAISQIGSRVIYTLTSATERKVMFDSLTPDSRFTWTLIGPDGGAVRDNYGQVLSGRRLRDSDSYSRVLFNLHAGAPYTLIVDADTDATGNYALRLLDLADATPIAYDTPTTWAPDEARTTALYSFEGTAGDQVVFDRIGYTDSRPIVHIYDPNGSEIYSQDFYYDSGTLSLGATGRYTIALEGQIDARGAQQQVFQVQRVGHTDVVPTVSTPVAFVNGLANFAGTLPDINVPKVFSFHLDATTRVLVDTLNSYPNYYTVWTLANAQGGIEARWGYDTDAASHFGTLLLAAGDDTFSVYTPYAWVPGFAYRLVDVGAATAISYGSPVTGTLTPASSTTVYAFDGIAGDRLFAQATANSNMNSAYWRVVEASSGALIGGNYFYNHLDGVLLPRSGHYLLTIEGQQESGGDASFGFTLFKNAEPTQPLTLGATTTGTIAQPGDTQRYSFTLGQASKLWFDSLTSRSDIVWRVLDKDGVSVFGDRYLYDYAWLNNTRFDLGAGQYTLVVDGSNAATGVFGFRLLDLAAATPIATGTAVSGQLAPANKTELYRLDATACDRYFFDVLARSGGNTYWRLMDPYGNYLFSVAGLSDQGTQTLAYTGTYTLAIEGYPDDAGSVNFSFNVTPVVDQAPIPLAIGVLPGPNLQVQGLAVAGADGSVHSGGSLNVAWTTANVGDRPVVLAFQERVVVKNAGGETLVNQLVSFDPAASGPIVAGGSVARSASVALPAGSRGAGVLTVSVFTDVGNAILEQGANAEGDNSAQASVTSALLTYPDLTVINLAMTPLANLAAGDQASVAWRVQNSGDKATSGAWADRVVVRNLSTGEVLLDQTTRVSLGQSTLASGAGLDRVLSFNWPGGRKAVGTFQVTVSTDVQGEVAEYNAGNTGETNNDASLQFTSAPDLTVSNLQVGNAAPVSGDVLNLQWTVNNAGNAATPQGWFDRVQVINTATGEYLVNVDVAYDPVAATGAALAAGGSVQRSFGVRIPDGLRSVGNLRVVVTVDQNAAGASLIPESNEGNNDAAVVQAVALKPYPNLVAGNLTAPPAQRSGDAMAVSFAVTNTGTLPTTAATWIDRVILSRDAVIGNGDDIVLASLTHNGALAAGASYNVDASVSVPAGLDGNYNLALLTDAFSADTEPDNRADNTSALRAVLLTAYHADLVPSFASVPATATGGGTMAVSWHVDNSGDAATNGGFWYDQLWLSPDGTLGAGAISLGVFSRNGSVAAGAGYDTTQQVAVPNGLTGNYRLVLATDVYNYIFESRFDTNNSVVSAGSVLISAAPAVDLRVQNVSGPGLAAAGQLQTVQWDVANTGAGTAVQPWTDQVFVSRDGTLANATYLGSLTHGASLAAGQAYHASLGVTVPDLADGAWRFVVLTDAGNQVYETGAADAETANSGAAPVTQLVHPDLSPADLSVGALVGGQTATLSWTVRNTGSGNAAASWLENVYLSTDSTLDGGDTYLGQVTVSGGLAAGASSAQSLQITVPVTASGNYRILVLSDAGNAVREVAGEANNLASLAVNVGQAPLPDLRVSTISGPSSGLAGRDVTVAYTVSNAGNAPAAGP